jgi:glycosyltransferase involved in cell wall biosynthesis
VSRRPRSTPSQPLRALSAPEISVVLAVHDDEERIGHQVKAIASHLSALKRSFEIVAVNNGSRDNSLSILELLAARLPELRVLRASAGGRPFLRGAEQAAGTLLVLIEASRRTTLAPIGWALSRLAAGRDAVILRDRYVVARLRPILPVLARASGPGLLFESVFERRAQALGLDVVGSRAVPKGATSLLLAPVLRFLAA